MTRHNDSIPTPRRVGWPAADRERGIVTFYLVAITVGLLALAGLVVDGGTAIDAREHAADLAQQAARAGADALSPASLHTANPTGLAADPAAARSAADTVLAGTGATATVTVTGGSVTVTVTVHQTTQILSAFGLTQINGTATATATELHGTSTGGS
jgi:Flp pilus assembly protein TadG